MDKDTSSNSYVSKLCNLPFNCLIKKLLLSYLNQDGMYDLDKWTVYSLIGKVNVRSRYIMESYEDIDMVRNNHNI